MQRFISNCSQNIDMTASSAIDRSVFISNTEKSNISSTHKVSDRTFQTNVNRFCASEQTYIAPEVPCRGQFLENRNVFKVPTNLPPRRETSVYLTTGSAASSRTRLQPARDDLNINGLQFLWNQTFELITHTMPLASANDFVRSVQDLFMGEMWQISLSKSTCGSTHASDVQEWLSSNPVCELGILASQVTQPNSAQPPVSSSEVKDVQSSIGPGHLSAIIENSSEDDIGLKFNNFSSSHLRGKTLIGQSADTTIEKNEDQSTIRKPNFVNKHLESNGTIQSLNDDAKKAPDNSKSKSKTVAKNYNKLHKTSKFEEKTGRAQKQKQTTVNETLNTDERAVSSRGRKITPCLKYWEGEKLSERNMWTEPDTTLRKYSKCKETDVSSILNESMTLRSHKHLYNINRKPESEESNISMKKRTTKSKKNTQTFFSTVCSQDECSERVSESFNGKSVKHGNMPQVKDFENKREQKVTKSEEKENKNCNVKPAMKILRKNPQVILHDIVGTTGVKDLMKQKSNGTVKLTRKRKVNTLAEMPNKKKKTHSAEQIKTEIQEDIFNASFNLFGYSAKSRLSNSFSQATPGTALNSIRKKAQGTGPLSKETPPSKHLASVLNNSETELNQSKKYVRGSADNVNKKNHVNQRVASKMSKGASGVIQGKARKEKQQLKSVSHFDDKTSAVLNDVIHGPKAGQKTPKNIQAIFRAYMKESCKNKLSGNCNSDRSFSDSDNDDLY